MTPPLWQSEEELKRILMKVKEEGGSGWGIHVYPWLIHVNVLQKPLKKKKKRK